MARPRTPKGRARRTHELLAAEYPDAECELVHDNPFQLIIATILSAQATDVGVNKVTPGLFARYPDAESLAMANPEEVEQLIGSLGLFRNKTKSIIRCANQLVERHGGEVPTSMKDLTALAGVGRKTANVVRSVALDLPGLPVDTHVLRLSSLLQLTELTDPVKVELELKPHAPGGRAGPVQSAHDPPRPPGVRRPPTGLRGVRAGLVLPVGLARLTRRVPRWH